MTITIADGRGALWQWDTGRRVKITDGVGVKQIHYQNRCFGCSVDVNVENDGTAIIPDELLQDYHRLTAYAYATDDTGAYTMVQQDFAVYKRAKPAGYVYTPTDQMTLLTIQRQIGDLADLTTEAKANLVAAINEAARTGGGAGSMDLRVADGYIQYSRDDGMTWENLIAVEDLKGADGTQGDTGPQGPKGDTGAKGDPGVPGKDGSDATVTAANIAGALGYTPAAPDDIPVVPAAEISANTAARHSHTNKAVIDGITGQVTADKVNAPDHITDLVQYGAFQIASRQIIKQIPTVPTALKNPNALTIKIGGTTVTYDGSAAKTVTIADGTEVEY